MTRNSEKNITKHKHNLHKEQAKAKNTLALHHHFA